ncbi:hypothetical protein HDV02_000180, partial [Globomyces sp. JEL0801]
QKRDTEVSVPPELLEIFSKDTKKSSIKMNDQVHTISIPPSEILDVNILNKTPFTPNSDLTGSNVFTSTIDSIVSTRSTVIRDSRPTRESNMSTPASATNMGDLTAIFIKELEHAKIVQKYLLEAANDVDTFLAAIVRRRLVFDVSKNFGKTTQVVNSQFTLSMDKFLQQFSG